MKLTKKTLADNKRPKKSFTTALHIKEAELTCDECAHSFKTTNKPRKLKQGTLALEDKCPSCGAAVLVAL